MQKPLINYSPIFLFSLCSAWMIGIGLRFIIDGFLNKGVYTVNSFDTLFDWGILAILGFGLLLYTFYLSTKTIIKGKTKI